VSQLRATRAEHVALLLSDRELRLESAIRAHIVAVYEMTGRNKLRTAELLGIDRRTLYDHLWRYGLHEVVPQRVRLVAPARAKVTQPVTVARPRTPRAI